ISDPLSLASSLPLCFCRFAMSFLAAFKVTLYSFEYYRGPRREDIHAHSCKNMKIQAASDWPGSRYINESGFKFTEIYQVSFTNVVMYTAFCIVLDFVPMLLEV
ncbi:hypothetical protein STEG23_033753, partial [Scotinomys teguina]